MSDDIQKTTFNAPQKMPELPKVTLPQAPTVSMPIVSAPHPQKPEQSFSQEKPETVTTDQSFAPSLPQVKPEISKTNMTMSTPTSIATPTVQQIQVEGKPISSNVPSVTAPKSENPYAKNFATDLNLPPKVLETKVMGAILAGLFFFGMMMGCVMSGGETTTRIQGLDGVVQNPDIMNKGGVGRCGYVPDPNKECVLYIMNAKTYDRLGSDFYQEAQNITGVPKYTIQLANVQYANALVRRGHIAQIYIPARR